MRPPLVLTATKTMTTIPMVTQADVHDNNDDVSASLVMVGTFFL